MDAAYRCEGVVVATDGSLKLDGAMGAAFIALGDKVPACSMHVFGSEMSIRPELSEKPCLSSPVLLRRI